MIRFIVGLILTLVIASHVFPDASPENVFIAAAVPFLMGWFIRKMWD